MNKEIQIPVDNIYTQNKINSFKERQELTPFEETQKKDKDPIFQLTKTIAMYEEYILTKDSKLEAIVNAVTRTVLT